MKSFKISVFLIHLLFFVLGAIAVYRIVSLAVVYGKYYKGGIDSGEEVTIENRTFKKETNTISGKRGSIFSDDGTVLLSNVFIYDLYWYPSYISEKNDSLFLQNVDSLIRIFHRINPKNSIDYYNKHIKEEYLSYRQAYKKAVEQTRSRDKNVKKQGYQTINNLRKKHVRIKISNLSRSNQWVRQKDINEIDSLFADWKGNTRFRGGCKKDRRDVRRQLSGGYPRSVLGMFEGVSSSNKTDSIVFTRGIEGYYDHKLRGESITYEILKVNNETVRLKENRSLAPNNGCNLVTTINNDIQRVTKKALEKQILLSGAAWGCAIVMEVESGEIKAICNLDRIGNYCREQADHATTERYEPGSTFKLLTLLAALKSGKVDTNTIVECGKGNYFTLKKAFSISDNKGLYNAAKISYGNISAFLLALTKMSLDKDLKIETAQARKPVLQPITRQESDFQNVTKGYSVSIPPIYMLAYYNAIANNGKYIKPKLVKSITYPNKETKILQHEPINSALASPEVIAKVKACLEAVVTEGTGKKARDQQYLSCIKNGDTNMLCPPLIAGKTGTAYIYVEKERKYSYELPQSHPLKDIKNSSFVGYFPSHKPKYTCLVLISGTTLDGGVVAVPVCKEIAEKLYLHDIEMDLSKSSKNKQRTVPTFRFAHINDIRTIYNKLQIPINVSNENQYVGISKNDKDEIVFTPRKIKNHSISELRQASVKDAVYILEKAGYTVQIKGKGKVNDIQIVGKKAIVILN